MFLTKFKKKTWKFPNKKGTFDVNLVFTATLACTRCTGVTLYSFTIDTIDNSDFIPEKMLALKPKPHTSGLLLPIEKNTFVSGDRGGAKTILFGGCKTTFCRQKGVASTLLGRGQNEPYLFLSDVQR